MLKWLIIIFFISFKTFLIAQEKEIAPSPVSTVDEYKVKREEVFEFIQKPQITKEGNNFTILFESKGFCDVTVAIENADGKIVRHLICGVLGPKAPAPLQKNSKVQKLVWDGKDDQEVYVKDDVRDGCVVRVSLGLKPQFERTMFWSPHKRQDVYNTIVMSAAPEGVYIMESSGVDQVRLFDHQGNYNKTIYPFPADKINKVNSLKMHTFIQDGLSKPLKGGTITGTLLTASYETGFSWGLPQKANAIASVNGQVAVSGNELNRLSSDGSSGGQSLYGPKLVMPYIDKNINADTTINPRSMAFSPDGKWLYLTGYNSGLLNGGWNGVYWGNGVMRMAYEANQPPNLWAGDFLPVEKGKENLKLWMPTSVACDATGRVYVSDYMNDRIQVFDVDGKVLKSIPIFKPANVAIHQKTGDIYVFSYHLRNFVSVPIPDVEPIMFHLGPYDNPLLKNKCPLPLTDYSKVSNYNLPCGIQHTICLDSWADKPMIWIANAKNSGISNVSRADDGSIRHIEMNGAELGSAKLFEEEENKLTLKHNFGDDTKKAVQRALPAILLRQRLVVNPKTGKLYVLESDSGVMCTVNQLVEITPETGAIKLVDLPLGAEDICFDVDGLIYIRTDVMVARFDPLTWKEIPFDYGVESEKHTWGMGAKAFSLVSGLQTPGHRTSPFWHQGGFDVSVKGHIAVSTCNFFEMDNTPKWHAGEAHFDFVGKPYKPGIYPGRMRWGEIHIWDKHGKVVKEDAVQGMGHMNGLFIDQDDNLYMLAASKRIIGGKETDPTMGTDLSGCLLKVQPGKAKLYSSNRDVPVPLPEDEKPKRSIDLSGYNTGWVEGAEWLYGGIGVGLGTPICICWNSRFTKDYFNRSFAPETRNYSVAIIDSNGNLILRVGKYGNVEDGKPLIADGGPKETKSIGGDEVGLFYACYVASHTDKRLFIADAGNARILSVKLGYNSEEKVPIKNMLDKK